MRPAGLPDAARVMAAIRATWPASEVRRVGPFDVPMDRNGTRRSRAARLAGRTATEADVRAVEAARPGGVFGTTEGDVVETLLGGMGYASEGHCLLMAGPVGEAPAPPPVSGFAHWPPLAICEAMWEAHGNEAARRAPMARAPAPKAAILLRVEARPAGVLFAALDSDVAVLHAVLTLPEMRRRGVGRIGMIHAAHWAATHGARHLALPVETGNAPAIALYEAAGMRPVGAYRYWRAP